MWRCKWSSFSTPLPDTPADALVFASQTIFPNIPCLFRLICTLPVTSCECKHSISVLRRLKIHLCSNMGQERLSGLALMHIHYGMELTWTKSSTFLLESIHVGWYCRTSSVISRYLTFSVEANCSYTA